MRERADARRVVSTSAAVGCGPRDADKTTPFLIVIDDPASAYIRDVSYDKCIFITGCYDVTGNQLRHELESPSAFTRGRTDHFSTNNPKYV